MRQSDGPTCSDINKEKEYNMEYQSLNDSKSLSCYCTRSVANCNNGNISNNLYILFVAKHSHKGKREREREGKRRRQRVGLGAREKERERCMEHFARYYIRLYLYMATSSRAEPSFARRLGLLP